ncbi:MAG: hypothetical protein KJO82_08670 [Gammaproteobacteria bacterium]|nr:hypothetical protein [Gammaproteobacteria bacterium]
MGSLWGHPLKDPVAVVISGSPGSQGCNAGIRVDEKIERLEQRIDALEKRLAEFERAGAGKETLLVAPVRIVDEAGNLIAEIAGKTNDNAIRIYNAKGQAVASLGADGTESGYVAIRNKSGKAVGYLDVERYGARLVLNSNNDHGGGLALFGADAGEAGGGINVIAAENGGGISLWAQPEGGEIRIEDAEGNETVIDPGGRRQSADNT